MTRLVKFLFSSALIGALVSTSVPATAATEVIAPTTSLAWLDGHATHLKFDPSDRLWVWNRSHNPSFPHGLQTNVLAKNLSGQWEHAYRLRIPKFTTRDLSFASNGTLYAVGFRKNTCKLAVVTFKVDGTVKKTKTHSFPRTFCPSFVSPIDGGKIALGGSIPDRGTDIDTAVREYTLPFSTRKRPVREIKFSKQNNSDMLFGADGTVYVSQGENSTGGVDVYSSSQRGTVSPDHSFTMHSDYGDWYIGGLAFTNTGQLAVRNAASVSIYSPSASGSNLVPDTFYQFSDYEMTFSDVAFSTSGVMATVDSFFDYPVRLFFETPSCMPRPEARC
jgi:hypothetical protein